MYWDIARHPGDVTENGIAAFDDVINYRFASFVCQSCVMGHESVFVSVSGSSLAAPVSCLQHVVTEGDVFSATNHCHWPLFLLGTAEVVTMCYNRFPFDQSCVKYVGGLIVGELQRDNALSIVVVVFALQRSKQCSTQRFTVILPRVGSGQYPLILHSPPSTLCFSTFYFYFFLFLTSFVNFLAFQSLPILPE